MGLEPTTLGTTNRCSNQLSYIYRLEFAKIDKPGLFTKCFFAFYPARDFVLSLSEF
jgi:hypothetical protein